MPNRKLDARSSLRLTAVLKLGWEVHDLFQDLRFCRKFSPAPTLGIGAVAHLELRMPRWPFVPDLVVSHFCLLNNSSRVICSGVVCRTSIPSISPRLAANSLYLSSTFMACLLPAIALSQSCKT